MKCSDAPHTIPADITQDPAKIITAGCGIYAHYRFDEMRHAESLRIWRKPGHRIYKWRQVEAAMVGAVLLGGARSGATSAKTTVGGRATRRA